MREKWIAAFLSLAALSGCAANAPGESRPVNNKAVSLALCYGGAKERYDLLTYEYKNSKNDYRKSEIEDEKEFIKKYLLDPVEEKLKEYGGIINPEIHSKAEFAKLEYRRALSIKQTNPNEFAVNAALFVQNCPK